MFSIHNYLLPSLCNLYCLLRANRFSSSLERKIYRQIADEKKRLIRLGADPELIRLECRYLANTCNRSSEDAFIRYAKQKHLSNPNIQ